MRHRKSGRQLNRNSSHRKAMFRNMAVSLIDHEMITTTVAKAKELRRVIEPLITLGKIDNVAKRRLAFARLRDDAAVNKLFTKLGPRFKTRPAFSVEKSISHKGLKLKYLKLIKQRNIHGN